MDDLRVRAEAEIAARHRFFVEWFKGTAEDTAIEDCARSFAPDFQMITPDGQQHSRDTVLSMLRGARGSRQGRTFAIEVETRHATPLAADLVLIVYDELQWTDDGRTARRSTAIFGANASAPGGVLWRHLQETWIAPATARQ